MRFPLLVAAIGAASWCAASAQASVISNVTTVSGPTLESVITNGDSIQVGDKLFSNFSYVVVGDMPLANQVTILLPPSNVSGIGLRFQADANAPFQDLPGGGVSDALLQYNVTVTQPGWKVTGAHLDSDLTVSGPGTFSIVDSFVPSNNPQVYIYNLQGSTVVNSATTNFNPGLTSFSVQKDIFADAGAVATGGVVPAASAPQLSKATYIDQTYIQVPEPATLGVLAFGVGALLFRRRKL